MMMMMGSPWICPCKWLADYDVAAVAAVAAAAAAEMSMICTTDAD